MLGEYKDIFSVTRADYKDFVLQIKPEARRVETVELNNYTTATKIFSKNTGKCLCSRVSYRAGGPDDSENRPEEYFIFEMPEDDERLEPIPRVQVELTTIEQVQKLFDGLSKMSKEHSKK